MRLLICGSRGYTDYDSILRTVNRLSRCHTIECIIQGGARGADKLASKVASNLRIPCEEYPAEWEKFGKAAGYQRNARMLAEGKPDYVLAFNLGSTITRGTGDMVRRAQRVGIPTEIYYS